MAIETCEGPKTLPITVGIVEKKPPFAMPFKMTNGISGANVVEKGQITKLLSPVKTNDRKSTFIAPIRSQRRPQQILPSADAKLKPATNPAPTLDGSPIDLA
jgi:hypothetical protein